MKLEEELEREEKRNKRLREEREELLNENRELKDGLIDLTQD